MARSATVSTAPGPRRLLPTARQLVLLVVGCTVLGVGVGLLLTADLGSDGYSTLVYGVALALDVPFAAANLGIGVLFVGLAALRRVVPGLGTVVQVVLVGLVVSWALELLAVPDAWWQQGLLLVAAFPVLALGIAAYLGSQTGAGPTEAMALAWDPPVPFRWSYSLVQGGGALVGWLCGATVGLGTLAVIALLGPGVDLAARVLRVDVHQPPAHVPDPRD